MPDRSDERSLSELFAELSRETSVLMRKEVELATTEMTAKLRIAGAHAAVIAAGGALAHAGLLVLLAALVLGLARLGVSAWLSALIVALVVIAIGYGMVTRGIASMRASSFAPTQTMESLKETATWTSKTRA
jgi:drug/metabolite transporter (DMT)-like permease